MNSIRTEMAIGSDKLRRLAGSTAAVVGLGGVGGYCAEILARSGVGRIILIDRDTVASSNINRQLIADSENIGKPKADEWAKRIKKINPDCETVPLELFYLPESREALFSQNPDIVIDAVDTVTAKLDLIEQCVARSISVLSSMGFGNKLDPTKIVVGDISKTKVCPLARVIRRELKKRDISNVTVVYSEEEPLTPLADDQEQENEAKKSPSSVSWVPSVAGIYLAAEAVKILAGGFDR